MTLKTALYVLIFNHDFECSPWIWLKILFFAYPGNKSIYTKCAVIIIIFIP